MGFRDYLNGFCVKNGYTGDFGYKEATKIYTIEIAKGTDIALASLTKEELQVLSNAEIKEILVTLDKNFKDFFGY